MKKRIVWLSMVAVLIAGCGREQTEPYADSGAVSGASCVKVFSPENLTAQEFAFDGVVAGVVGDEIEFTVNTWFKGPGTASIKLKAPVPLEPGSVTSTDFPSINKGDRYLVSGEEEFAHPCGFTKVYTETDAAEWQDSFK